MYALVHKTKAQSCAPALEQAGFTVLLVNPPLLQSDIRGKDLRGKIHREVCCGADEFIKLYAYTQMKEHPLVVHLDIDFIFQKPLDDLFDVMLATPSSIHSNDKNHQDDINSIRQRIEREDGSDSWPDDIQAMITRDYHSSYGEGRKSGFQAGFWIIKPSQAHFDKLVDIVKEGNYTDGFGRDNGWVRT
jgi:alpha-N-acetylglucosamine transferase